MPLQNNDLLLVNRNGGSHRYSFENLKRDVLSDIELQLTGLEWVTAIPNRPDQISGLPNPATTPRDWNTVDTLLIGVGNDISNVTLGSTLVLTNTTTGNSGTYTVSAVDAAGNTITVAYVEDTGGDIQAGNTFGLAAFKQFETSSVEIGDTPPVGPDAGDLWFNTDDGRLYIFYTDANSSQWVDASPDNAANPYWQRNGTTLSPANAGDSVDIGSGNIQLNNDGSAEFAGDILTGESPNNGAGVGARLSVGGIKVARTSDTQTLFSGFKVGTSSPTVSMLADGSAYFLKQAIVANYNNSDDNGHGIEIKSPDKENASLTVQASRTTPTGRSAIRVYRGTNVVWGVNYAGNANFSNTFIQLETDNPANFNVEGEYTGPTLDVKERILNLISRLDAIEANEQIDDATDTSLLQLVANASARLDSIEARLTALEGGN